MGATTMALDGAWPPGTELEQWIARSAGDADETAGELRRMLQVNPGYGTHLALDEEPPRIVQLFAKRFRAKIIASESPIQTATLFQPLCEVIWRVSAHVVTSLSEFGTPPEGGMPLLPNDARGQLKLL